MFEGALLSDFLGKEPHQGTFLFFWNFFFAHRGTDYLEYRLFHACGASITYRIPRMLF